MDATAYVVLRRVESAVTGAVTTAGASVSDPRIQ
jgi:hypothetical protein